MVQIEPIIATVAFTGHDGLGERRFADSNLVVLLFLNGGEAGSTQTG